MLSKVINSELIVIIGMTKSVSIVLEIRSIKARALYMFLLMPTMVDSVVFSAELMILPSN